MMYPILCKVRYEALHEILLHRGIWKQILFSIILNWIVAPFLMVGSTPFPCHPNDWAGNATVDGDGCLENAEGPMAFWNGIESGFSRRGALNIACFEKSGGQTAGSWHGKLNLE